eukprot:CAMPEP_0201123260 /NCGR_PEP_ID=MMETSP0850-20130426/6681_1 /ASSEMBLY_ACC=CAM_ASM_000622 /TAXON_ID=183588 /ORGANISM="Pseudo-nitzschia fraudulenta, Strain WWA7" /LENGTH=118 /DNA_ID=CAMNT_0047390127 /DNA_START=516 /DNA_END=875 /DNA_ORIENTATION=-
MGPDDGNDGDPTRRMQLMYGLPFHKIGEESTCTPDEEQVARSVDAKFGGHANLDHVNDAKTTQNYFPHSKDLFECNPWKVRRLQAKNDLYFIGGIVNFESVEHIIRYNNYILDEKFEA